MPRGLPVTVLLLLVAASAFSLYWVYQVDRALCNGCGNCLPWCAQGAISMQGPDAWIDPAVCTACGECVYHCPRGAISRVWFTGTGEAGLEPTVPLVSPNPSSGALLVTGVAEGQVLDLYDVSGRLVATLEAQGPEALLEVPGRVSGICLLAVDGIPVGTVSVIR
jgi:NAD-dependent dihydropyrimidine dehydrogenase PreA subunit